MKRNQDELIQLKERIKAMVDVEENQLEAIVSRFTCRTVDKHEFLLQQGGRCDFWGFVHSGLLRVFAYDSAGEEYTNGFIQEGSFITESVSFFTSSVSLEYIQALEKTTLVCVNASQLQQLYDQFPAFDKFARMIYEQRLIGLKTRILYRVQFDAQTRYLHFIQTQPGLFQRVPLKYIASYLSVTDSTLSRIRRNVLQAQR